jgi:hypothetical protein
MGLDGDFNLRRLERYLALAKSTGALPVVQALRDEFVGLRRLGDTARVQVRQDDGGDRGR